MTELLFSLIGLGIVLIGVTHTFLPEKPKDKERAKVIPITRAKRQGPETKYL